MSAIVRELGSAIAKLRVLLDQPRKNNERILQQLTSLVAALDTFWEEKELKCVISSQKLWDEAVLLLGSGRVVAVVAQAEDTLSASKDSLMQRSWASDGKSFVEWLANGMMKVIGSWNHFKHGDVNPEHISRLALLFAKTMSMGNTDTLIQSVIIDPLTAQSEAGPHVREILSSLNQMKQIRVLDSCLSILCQKYLPIRSSIGFSLNAHDTQISGAASLLRWVTSLDPQLEAHLFRWILRPPCVSNEALRATICVFDGTRRAELLHDMFSLYHDKLFIKHAPVVQQEVAAQLLLMNAGYIHRENPMELFVLARSKLHISGTSEHLSSSVSRVRFLGMVMAATISKLADKESTKVTFDFDDMDQPDVKWYQSLVEVNDQPTSPSDLRYTMATTQRHQQAEVPRSTTFPHGHLTITKKSRIVNSLSDGDGDNLGDLPSYSKPQLDEEDSDDDATLVRRDKPRAPFYIRDLVVALRDTSDYETLNIALRTGPSLIRRKADFGNELRDRATELGSILLALNDTFEMEDFDNMRMQNMAALLVSQPAIIGPLYVNCAFNGEYSLGQRVGALGVVTLGAQELVGNIIQPRSDLHSLPSLSERLHKLYVESLDLYTTLQDIEGEKQPGKGKVRSSNDRREIVMNSVYLPLLSGWQFAMQSGSKAVFSVLLPTFLKTLALVFNACALNSLRLPELTAETWDLLLSVRSAALEDEAILEALLFALLTLISINDDKRRLALDHGKHLVETQNWVQTIMERIIGGSEVDEKCKALSTAILLAMKDISNIYQRLLVGSVVF